MMQHGPGAEWINNRHGEPVLQLNETGLAWINLFLTYYPNPVLIAWKPLTRKQARAVKIQYGDEELSAACFRAIAHAARRFVPGRSDEPETIPGLPAGFLASVGPSIQNELNRLIRDNQSKAVTFSDCESKQDNPVIVPAREDIPEYIRRDNLTAQRLEFIAVCNAAGLTADERHILRQLAKGIHPSTLAERMQLTERKVKELAKTAYERLRHAAKERQE